MVGFSQEQAVGSIDARLGRNRHEFDRPGFGYECARNSRNRAAGEGYDCFCRQPGRWQCHHESCSGNNAGNHAGEHRSRSPARHHYGRRSFERRNEFPLRLSLRVHAGRQGTYTRRARHNTGADPETLKAAAEPPPKPPAAIKPVKPVDPVSEAQKYIYGRGVTQDCERGMRLLKPAAEQANPKAMIEMGALYSAGLCTPHDLPTAYRWFALALRKDPDNESVQTDLQKLWGEMTQPERQLAIKLSQ